MRYIIVMIFMVSCSPQKMGYVYNFGPGLTKETIDSMRKIGKPLSTSVVYFDTTNKKLTIKIPSKIIDTLNVIHL